MTDTIRTVAALQALLADGATANGTNRQLLRDMLVSLDNEVTVEAAARAAADAILLPLAGGTISGPITVQGITVGRGNGATNGNTAVGNVALSTNTSGTANTAFGFGALQNNLDAPGNTALGYGAMGGSGTGNGANTGVGYQCCGHTTGTQNVGIGYWALQACTTGSNNTAVGYRAMMTPINPNYCAVVGYASFDALCGDFNTGIGGFAGTTNTGTLNTIGGYFSFKSSTSGDQNTTWGAQTLVANVSGSRNVALGYFAGHYELGSDSFYVDNQDRTNTAGDKAKAMFYGVFNATPASQTLVVNAATTISQTLAVTGGVTAALTGNVTGNLTGTVLTAAQASITSLGTLSSLTVSGGGITCAGSIIQNGVAGDNQMAGRIRWTGLWNGANAAGTISQNTSHGIFLTSVAGSINDFNLVSPSFGSILRVPTGTQNTVFAGTMTVTGAFGCNTKAAQTAVASGGALSAYAAGANGLSAGSDMSALVTLVTNIRTALVANGIMS